nr:hypothetical protein [Megavirus caiporensis]
MSYKNQMLKQVTNGKCDRRTYFNMINKKAHPRGRNQNQNDKSSDLITDLIVGKKTFDDYNKDSDENENEKNQFDNLSQNNDSNNNNDNDDNDNDNDHNDNDNDHNDNNNNNNEISTMSHARKPGTSNKSIVTVSMPSRLRKPMSNRGSLYTMQNNNNDNNNNKLLNKIDILEAKIIKLEAKIKILNLQMNTILENHN